LQIIETKDAEQISETIIQTLKKAFFNKESPFYVENILDLQILSSTKKYEAGTIQLNKAIKKAYNNDESSAETDFSVGDKIMMIENNYDIGYYNGDIGFIKEIDEAKDMVVVEIDSEEYGIPKKNIKDISLAYASTVHKSQGSEYQYVIIALPKEPTSILQRNLIYTAITRAKKYVAIIYEKEALLMAVNRNDSIKRRTSLKQKILAKL
jgi:exodeoxyribonuclease V alpha subunit